MSDDRQEPPAGDADTTRAMPSSGNSDADATRPMPAAGDAAGREPQDATRPMPRAGGGANAHREPVDATAPLPPTPPAWSGRAGVPTRLAAYQEPGAEWYAEEQAARRWWMPILLGILALLLIALIGVGVWLALRAAERNPGPAPLPTPVPTTASATSAAPSSSPPTTSASPTSAEVPMPPLVGLPESAARVILDRLGVDYRVRTRASDRPAGTVIETDPAAGELIADGQRVTLVVAQRTAPTTGAGTPPPTAPTATPTP
ncbi:PASTA domain-containing protein [Micromonospora yasonensis]|uniref:PASTA domain-containing protein n=1 Tax=Micromonospora yasonensis TaxID=1128667 RepID=UPI002232B628|nr:PASTA domain-containing protein [Micromonospora yasonensis]MCW3842426.1 PASTA domain-containing protein [Micromonospora yasonensis]